jgi:quinoprotein glucose dehydrogenase
LIENAILGDLYTPVGLATTVLFPGTNGGANWGGASYDPESHTLYVNSMDVGTIKKMVPRGEGARIPYGVRGIGTPESRFWDMNRYPCQKPPWEV